MPETSLVIGVSDVWGCIQYYGLHDEPTGLGNILDERGSPGVFWPPDAEHHTHGMEACSERNLGAKGDLIESRQAGRQAAPAFPALHTVPSVSQAEKDGGVKSSGAGSHRNTGSCCPGRDKSAPTRVPCARTGVSGLEPWMAGLDQWLCYLQPIEWHVSVYTLQNTGGNTK